VREDDEEMFEMNPVEYIRRDAEGSDADTRRRAAADLLRALSEKYEAQVRGRGWGGGERGRDFKCRRGAAAFRPA
jgi:hypothetical protein